MNVQELFPIKVGEVFPDFEPNFNQNLLAEMHNVRPTETNGQKFNFFDYCPVYGKILEAEIIKQANSFLEASGTTRKCTGIVRGWPTWAKFGDMHMPETHHVMLVAVYYPYIPEGPCGNLCLLDPAPETKIKNKVTTNTKMSGGTAHEIKAVTGKMVFMPGYLQHMVPPNMSNDLRVSISANLRLD